MRYLGRVYSDAANEEAMMPLTELALRLGMALAAGACIGMERQWHQHRAGLRTNVLVALGAALFVALGAMTPGESSPTRIASYVVSGVGFLGAGAIIRDGLDVRGLNTAATLWCAAAVGALAGFGYFPAAALGAVAVLGTNIILRPMARRLTRTTPTVEAPVAYTVMVRCRRTRETAIRAMILRELQPTALVLRKLHSMRPSLAVRPAVVEVHAHVLATGPTDAVLEQIVARLSHETDVSEVSWSVGWDDHPADGAEALGAESQGDEALLPASLEEQQRRAAPVSTGDVRRARDRRADDHTGKPPSSRLAQTLMLATM
jgi:putative Mg2+ transporter-C (MgtC) family protein